MQIPMSFILQFIETQVCAYKNTLTPKLKRHYGSRLNPVGTISYMSPIPVWITSYVPCVPYPSKVPVPVFIDVINGTLLLLIFQFASLKWKQPYLFSSAIGLIKENERFLLVESWSLLKYWMVIKLPFSFL